MKSQLKNQFNCGVFRDYIKRAIFQISEKDPKNVQLIIKIVVSMYGPFFSYKALCNTSN